MIFSPAAGRVPSAWLAAMLIETVPSPPVRGSEPTGEFPPEYASPQGESYGLSLHHVLARGLRLDAVAQLAPELAPHLGREQARHLVVGLAGDRLELGIGLLVRLADVRAARVERAPAGQVDQRRRAALDRHQLLAARRVQPRDRGQQAPRVRV